MFDSRVRPILAPRLNALAGLVDRSWLSPDRLTYLGLAAGIGSAGAAAAQLWWLGLGLWLASRLLDGLDGPLARRRQGARPPGSQAGGFLDITADFVTYGASVVGVAVGVSQQFGASWLPFMLVLLAYYVNGAAFLAFSSIAERTGHRLDDGRSLSFLGGLAEGTETVVVHSLWLAVPALAPQVAWGWAVVVAVSAAQRIRVGVRILRNPPVESAGRPG